MEVSCSPFPSQLMPRRSAHITGAIRLSFSRFTCEMTTFDSNKALNGARRSAGGALHLDDSKADLGHTVFSANRAHSSIGVLPSCGGAVSIMSEIHKYDTSDAASNDTVAIDEAGLSAIDFHAEAVMFDGNVAEGANPKGGAICLDDGRVIFLNGSTFTANRVSVFEGSGSGGALHAESGEARLANCRLAGNIVRMSSPTSYDATAGGVSVGGDARLEMNDTYMLSNRAGGVGQYETSRTFQDSAKATRKRRAAHILCHGKASINRCTFQGTHSDTEPAVEHGAQLFLVGKDRARIVLMNSVLIGTEREAIIGLDDAAEALVRGCTASGVTINRQLLITGRLGIVNSSFDPQLDSTLSAKIVPPTGATDSNATRCGVEVAGERVCDPRAFCEWRTGGGVQCACIGEGLRDMAGAIADGRACEQETRIGMQVQLQEVILKVHKPTIPPLKVRILVVGQGEERFNAVYTMSMGLNNATTRSNPAANYTSWHRIGERQYSLNGHHVVFSVPMASDSIFEFSRKEQMFALTKEFEMQLHLDCEDAEPCVADGDVVTTLVETGTASNPSSQRSKVSVITEVVSLIACEKSSVSVVGGVVDAIATEVPIRLLLEAFDVDGLPIRFNRLETDFRFGQHLLPVQWCATALHTCSRLAACAIVFRICAIVFRYEQDSRNRTQTLFYAQDQWLEPVPRGCGRAPYRKSRCVKDSCQQWYTSCDRCGQAITSEVLERGR